MNSVLLVDDHTDSREVLREALQDCGYLVVEASNGLEALATLEAQSAFSLVILDLSMPIMTGYEFIEVVRARSEFNDVPIIVMSGDGSAEQVLSSGRVRAYLTKPVQLDCLLKAIAQHGSFGRGPPCA